MDELSKYLIDPYDAEANFNMAVWYEDKGHFSPASGFYLRAAEFANDYYLAYESLLRMSLCYKSLGGRDYACENILKSALDLKPRSPEAYFLLSQHYEMKKNWMDSYLFASLGIDFCGGPSSLRRGVGYASGYMLSFQKAVAAWWYGKPEESAQIFRHLMDNCLEMDDSYRTMVHDNLKKNGSIKWPPDTNIGRTN